MQVRRNNPGNIKKDIRWTWQGELPGSQPGEILSFDTLVNGSRALLKDLQTKIRAGTDTISKILNKYAPPKENPTEQYIGIAFVSEETGIPADKKLNASDLSTLSNIAMKMTFFEHGIKEDDGTLLDSFNKAKDMLIGIIQKNPLLTVLVVGGLFWWITSDND